MIKFFSTYLLFLNVCLHSIYGIKAKHPPFIYVVPDGGRMGDQLLLYTKAKWMSYKNNIPLILTPNKHYNHFIFSNREAFSTSPPSRGRKLVINKTEDSINNNIKGYYQINYFPLPDYEMLLRIKNDLPFMKNFKKLTSSLKPLSLISIPEDKISIAIHVRTESNGPKGLRSTQIYNLSNIETKPSSPNNKNYMDWDFPEKFPPLQFFIDQIKYLSEYFDHPSLYVYIFTDHHNPKEISSKIEENLNLNNVTIDYRHGNFNPDQAILEDFFSMMEFDCLIRPKSSNYSLIAELLGTNKIIISPKNYHWEKDASHNYYLVIDEVIITSNHEIN